MGDEEKLREEIVRVLRIVAQDGLPNPKDEDVAADAILAAFEAYKPN